MAAVIDPAQLPEEQRSMHPSDTVGAAGASMPVPDLIDQVRTFKVPMRHPMGHYVLLSRFEVRGTLVGDLMHCDQDDNRAHRSFMRGLDRRVRRPGRAASRRFDAIRSACDVRSRNTKCGRSRRGPGKRRQR